MEGVKRAEGNLEAKWSKSLIVQRRQDQRGQEAHPGSHSRPLADSRSPTEHFPLPLVLEEEVCCAARPWGRQIPEHSPSLLRTFLCPEEH